MTSFDLVVTVTASMAFAAYIVGLPKLFLTFKGLFSLGEGCLVLQAVLISLAHAVINLNSYGDNSSSDNMEINSAVVMTIFCQHVFLAMGNSH